MSIQKLRGNLAHATKIKQPGHATCATVSEVEAALLDYGALMAEVSTLRRELADLKIFAYERAPKIAIEEANRQIEPLKEEIERLRVALEEIRDKRLPQVCEDYENCAHVGCEASYAAFAIADKALRKEEGANNVLQ